MKFHENTCKGAKLFHVEGRTDGKTRDDEVSSWFSQFCESAYKKGSGITVLPSYHLYQKWQIAGLTLRKEWQMYANCNKRQLSECLKKTVKCNMGKSSTFSPETPFLSPRKVGFFGTALSIAVTHHQAMKPTASDTAKLTCGHFSSTPALLKCSPPTPSTLSDDTKTLVRVVFPGGLIRLL